MKYRYFHKGEPLVKYCKEHGINIGTITTNINKKQKKYPELTDQEVVDLVMSRIGSNVKYFYNGILLTDYCRSNDIDYSQIISRIRTLKEHNSSLNNDEAVKIAIEDYQIFQTIYFYKGIPLIEYCKLHPNIKYSSVLTSVKRTKSKFPAKKEEDIINEYIQKKHRKPKRFFINGVPLKKYCEKNGINNSTLINNISKYRNDDEYKNLSEKERLELILERYKKSETLYFYDGISLFEYCKNNDYLYSSVYNYIQEKIKADKDVTVDEAIEEAITTIKRFGIIYYYNGVSLVQYCKDNDLNVSYVRDTIKRKKDKFGDTRMIDDIIEETVKEYEQRKYIQEISKIFSELNQNQIGYERVKEMCETLKIDLSGVKRLIDMGYSLKKAISIIWYFYDQEDNELKNISDEKVADIRMLIESIKRNDYEYDLFTMYAIYKCGLLDTRSIILAEEKNYFRGNIKAIMSYDMNRERFEDLLSEQKACFINFLEKCNSNIVGQMIKYMDLTIKWHLKVYYYKNHHRMVSLDEKIFDTSHQTRLDFYATKTVEQSEFSDEMQAILASLPSEYLEFIVLRYQECYDDEELCIYYNCEAEELREKEINVLSYLKEKTNVQSQYLKRRLKTQKS